jgi:RND family efflux transporter MFP subunit
MTTILTYVRAHKKTTVLIGILIIGGVYYAVRPAASPLYQSITITKGSVVQEVSVTGRVNSESEVQLAFEKGGRVLVEPTAVGMHVKSGDVLVRLDASEIAALREQAKANIAFETANLALLKKGNRAEDIAVSLASVASAETALADSNKGLFDKLGAAYTISDDVVHNTIDQFFRNARTRNPEFIPPTSDAKTLIDLQSQRVTLEATLVAWSSESGEWDHDKDADIAITTTNTSLAMLKDYLDLLARAINAVQSSSQTPQGSIDAWKLSVSSARSAVNSAITATLSGAQAYRSAVAALHVAKEQLVLKQAGATPESIAAQEARIASMQASLDNYDAQIAKTVIRAPFAGVVTKQDAKIGQTVTPNVPVVSLMSDGKFQIEANVPEVDVAKISVGDLATITLDAYGSDVSFFASVSSIDPAETIIEGVSTYKVTLRFSKDDARIRSGMTANIVISTDRRDDVLFVPMRAVTTKDEKKYVNILEGGVPKEVEVTLGLKGSSGTIEVKGGLTEGQSVVTVMPN